MEALNSQKQGWHNYQKGQQGLAWQLGGPELQGLGGWLTEHGGPQGGWTVAKISENRDKTDGEYTVKG